MTYEQEEHERDLYEEARAEQQHAVAYTERENENLLKTVERLENQNRDMRDALVQIEIIGRGTGSNSKACSMSNIARTALAQGGK